MRGVFEKFRDEFVANVDLREFDRNVDAIITNMSPHQEYIKKTINLSYMVQEMGVELTMLLVVEIYRRDRLCHRLFTDSSLSLQGIIDSAITWINTIFPYGIDKSAEFFNRLNYAFKNLESRSEVENKLKELEPISISNLIELYRTGGSLSKKRITEVRPKTFKAWN